MEAVKSANELRDIQRANQARSDFQEFTPDLTTDFTGLKLGAQPETYNIAKETEAARLAKAKEDYDTRIKNRAIIDPSLAEGPSPSAVGTNYNQFQNEVERLMKRTRTTGLTPNILTDSPPLTDQLAEAFGVDTPGESYLYKLDKDGNPISYFGNPEDKTETRRGVIRYLQERDKNLPLGMSKVDDVNAYIDSADRSPGSAANELQRRFRKQQLEELSAKLNFTKEEREELEKISSIKNNDERDKAKREFNTKLDIRLQRDRLKGIKDLPDGPDKLKQLDEFRAGLRTSIFDDEKIFKRREDGSFDTVGVPKILEEIKAIRDKTDPSEIANTFQNVTLSSANDTVRAAIAKRNQIVAQANLAKSEGNRTKFDELVSQLSALDNGIILAQGMQGLNDLDVGDTRRLNSVLTNSLGRNVQIIPRDDNSFDVVNLREGTDGKPIKMTAKEIKREAQILFDTTYREQMKKTALETAQLILKNKLEIRKQLFTSQAEYSKALAVEKQKGINELRKAGFTITKTEDGTIVQKDGAIGIIDEKTVKDQAGDEQDFLYVRPVNLGELGSGVGLSVDDYIGATQ